MPKSWTDGAPEPVALQEHAHLKDPLSYKIKRRLLGGALNRHTLSHQRLDKKYALGILSSDCISSSAYGSEQILIALLPAFGIAAFAILMPMTAIVLVILLIITLSYRNVIDVYTKTGGAYIVSRENFGPVVAQIAGVALMLDYIVTLAIQSAAGVAAIISTFPELEPWKIPMILAIIVLLTYGNLRGVKEAGKAFALPTYLFVGSMFIVFAIGLYRHFSGTLPMLETNLPGAVPMGEPSGLLTFAAIFILLRAFANGGSSLTGLEAISDGVALFKAPEHVNARRTLVIMSTLLGSLVLGVSWFAHKIHAMPYESGTPTVISQIVKAAMGDGTFGTAMFIFVQFATMLILFAGANTTYSAFPLLVNFIAKDGYLPRQLTKRGHRLAFSNGILLLAGGGIFLVLITAGSVEHLVAFYALGVFTGFTLAGFGMTKHAYVHRLGAWKAKMIINGLKAVHFVIDDLRAEQIAKAWAKSDALDDVTLELIDCPDRRLANAAVDYAIKMTEKADVELTLLLPRRSYSRFLGRLLHDRTAEAIAAPISQLPRVVATIVPFDVERILSGAPLVIDRKEKKLVTVAPVKTAPVVASAGPISHYAEDMTPIGAVQWRKRAHVQGKVASIKTAPSGSAPVLEVELWDETGGITLQFLGRREIAGLEVGAELRAEGMVGEENGSLQILNPSYELLA